MAQPIAEPRRESARRAPAMQSRAIQIPVWWRCAILILPSLPLGSCHLRGVVRGCLLLEPTWSPCVFAFFLSPSRAMTQVRPARSVHTTRTRQRSVGGVHHLPGAPVVLPAPRTPPHRVSRVRGHPAVTQYMRTVHVGNQDPVWGLARSPGRPLPGPVPPIAQDRLNPEV